MWSFYFLVMSLGRNIFLEEEKRSSKIRMRWKIFGLWMDSLLFSCLLLSSSLFFLASFLRLQKQQHEEILCCFCPCFCLSLSRCILPSSVLDSQDLTSTLFEFSMESLRLLSLHSCLALCLALGFFLWWRQLLLLLSLTSHDVCLWDFFLCRRTFFEANVVSRDTRQFECLSLFVKKVLLFLLLLRVVWFIVLHQKSEEDLREGRKRDFLWYHLFSISWCSFLFSWSPSLFFFFFFLNAVVVVDLFATCLEKRSREKMQTYKRHSRNTYQDLCPKDTNTDVLSVLHNVLRQLMVFSLLFSSRGWGKRTGQRSYIGRRWEETTQQQ